MSKPEYKITMKPYSNGWRLIYLGRNFLYKRVAISWANSLEVFAPVYGLDAEEAEVLVIA